MFTEPILNGMSEKMFAYQCFTEYVAIAEGVGLCEDGFE
jgi:hypothetical protein